MADLQVQKLKSGSLHEDKTTTHGRSLYKTGFLCPIQQAAIIKLVRCRPISGGAL
jgi:hypothetical protein